MKTVRFENKGLAFTAALRKNVNNYFKEKNISTKGNWVMILKATVMLTLYLSPFAIMLLFPLSAWMIFPLAVLAGLGMAGTGMSVMHDAVHGSLSKKKWLNKLLSWTMYLIGGNVFNWKIQHNIMHHTYTNIEGLDEDIATKTVIRLSKHAPLKKFHRFQHFYALFFYSFMTLSKLVGDFRQLWLYNKSGITRQQNARPRPEYMKLIGSKALYLFVAIGLPVVLAGLSWWLVLLGFLVMHLTASMIMSVIFQMAHVVEGNEQPLPAHDGSIANEWMIHELSTTANFSPNSKWFTCLIGGLNFQIEHHLFPNICHIHYRKISPIVQRTAHEFGICYNQNGNFFRTMSSHMRMLKALGRPSE